MRLARKYPWVQCFGNQDWQNTPEDLACFYTLFFRRVKAKVLQHVGGPENPSLSPLALWPCLLAKQPEKFSEEYSDSPYHGSCSCCKKRESNLFWSQEADFPTQPDILYRLLLEYGPAFVPSRSVGSTKPTAPAWGSVATHRKIGSNFAKTFVNWRLAQK